MALQQASLPSISAIRSTFSSSSSITTSLAHIIRLSDNDRKMRRKLRCRAMVQQAVQGAPAAYAKEMERLSAKESLLLAVSSSFSILFKIMKQVKRISIMISDFDFSVSVLLTSTLHFSMKYRNIHHITLNQANNAH